MTSYHSIREYPTCTLTRLAPTPSGFLHLGNILSFALTAYFAERTGARILLRIDDMDQLRAEKKYVDDIFETLAFMGLHWQQGPSDYTDYMQQHTQRLRMLHYQQALQQLADAGHVFACTCSRSQLAQLPAGSGYPGTCEHKKLPLDTPDASWRIKTYTGRILTVQRLVNSSISLPLPDAMHGFVVRKKDGDPAYQLTSLLDDQLAGTDLIVRGIDLWPSTWAQLYLANLLDMPGFGETRFIHHPLLLGTMGQKLSKSARDTSIRQLRLQGWSAAEIYTHITSLLGFEKKAGNWHELAVLATRLFA
ncbi:MAG: glutamate--tRNA ligase family protein [Chitinophagaceae bacterium]